MTHCFLATLNKSKSTSAVIPGKFAQSFQCTVLATDLRAINPTFLLAAILHQREAPLSSAGVGFFGFHMHVPRAFAAIQ